MSPPRKATSDPARMGAWMSAMALVRVKRGSTWMSLPPASLALATQRKATGWHSAMFEPWITTRSESSMLRGYSVAAPRPSRVPSPGTLEHLGEPVRVDVELEDGRALGAEGPLVVRAAGVALDVGDLAVHGVHQRGAAHRTIGAEARHRLRILDAQLLGPREDRTQVGAEAGQTPEGGAGGGGGGGLEKRSAGHVHGGPPRAPGRS